MCGRMDRPPPIEAPHNRVLSASAPRITSPAPYPCVVEFSFWKGFDFVPISYPLRADEPLDFQLLPWMNESLRQLRRWWRQTGYRPMGFRKNNRSIRGDSCGSIPRKNTHETTHEATHEAPLEGSLRKVMLRYSPSTGGRMVCLTTSGNPLFALAQEDLSLLSRIMNPKISLFLLIQQQLPSGAVREHEMHLSGPSHIRALLSFSPKRPLTVTAGPRSPILQDMELIIQAIRDEITLSLSQATLLTINTGIGYLPLGLFSLFHKVIVLEEERSVWCDAKETFLINALNHKVSVLCQDASTFLKDHRGNETLFPIIAPAFSQSTLHHNLLQTLLRTSPPHLIYLSHHPVDQKEDIAVLQRKYLVEKKKTVEHGIQPTQATHIVFLKRRLSPWSDRNNRETSDELQSP